MRLGGSTAALGGAALILGLALTGGPARATAIAKAVEPTIGEQIYAAAKLYDDNHCERAGPILDNAMARPEFAKLDARVQPLVYEMAASCAAAAGEGDKGLAFARTGTGYPGASDRLWALRLGLAIDRQAWDDAVGTVETLARERTKLLNRLDPDWLFRLDRALAGVEGGAALRVRLAAALGGGDYSPEQPFATADGWRLARAVALIDAGDRSGARAILARIASPDLLLEAALDGRTAELAPDPAGLRAAAERRLADDRATAAARPELLQGMIAVARDLRLLGRPDEAVAALEAAAPKLVAAPAPFADLEGQRAWFWNERAWALWEAGRFDAAIEAMTAASALPEQGGPNVSQTINLAVLLVEAGRPDVALKAIERFGPEAPGVSAYGLMWVASLRACAFAEQNRAEPLQAAMAELQAHAADNPAALASARLCAGDLDGAAAIYVARLAAPQTRVQALVALSGYDRPVKLTPHRRLMLKRLDQVRARPEVQAAVARAGRTLTVPLRPAFWGDF